MRIYIVSDEYSEGGIYAFTTKEKAERFERNFPIARSCLDEIETDPDHSQKREAGLSVFDATVYADRADVRAAPERIALRGLGRVPERFLCNDPEYGYRVELRLWAKDEEDAQAQGTAWRESYLAGGGEWPVADLVPNEAEPFVGQVPMYGLDGTATLLTVKIRQRYKSVPPVPILEHGRHSRFGP